MTLIDRIRKRIDKLGTNVAKVERDSGLTHAFVSDVMLGRKKTLKPEALKKVASTLRTTEVWLTHGHGAESTDEQETKSASVSATNRQSASERFLVEFTDLKSVSDASWHSIHIYSLNLRTAGVSFYDANQTSIDGIIVDPGHWIANSPYARSMSLQHPLRVSIKIVEKSNGNRVYTILDCEKSAY